MQYSNFQFQLGTIKTKIDSVKNIGVDSFQFQLGTIKTWLKVMITTIHTKLSIPTWYD